MIEKIILQENDKHYLLLKILPTEACKTFYNGIRSLEENHNRSIFNHKEWFNKSIGISTIKSSILNENDFLVKIPFKYSKPMSKLYSKNGTPFNYYHLKPGMEVICLLGTSNIWINVDNSVSYNLSVKEILITKTI